MRQAWQKRLSGSISPHDRTQALACLGCSSFHRNRSVNILILYLATTRDLKTLYDTAGKYDHVEVGDFVLNSVGVSGWVVDLSGCVQEGDRMLREERAWLLEQGQNYAQSQLVGTAVLVYHPQTDNLTTVFDTRKQYNKLGESVNSTYALSLWHDCTADSIPEFMQAEQLEPAYREFFLQQGRAYAQLPVPSAEPVPQ